MVEKQHIEVTMETRRNEIDSDVLQSPVLEIVDFDAGRDFRQFEDDYVRRYNPLYVTCKVPAEQIQDVHRLEEQGFRFLEFQLRLRGSPKREYETSGDYSYLPANSERDLSAVLDIASSIFEHDRYSRDPFFQRFAGRNIAGERYRRYVQKSVAADDEFVYKLVNNQSGEIVGFGTHRIVAPDQALLLIGGVKNEYKASGLGVTNDHLGLNELRRKGIKWFYTHVSAANYPIINLEVRALGFRLVTGFVVLRKIYQR